MKFKHKISPKLQKTTEELEAMIAAHKAEIPVKAVEEFYEKYPDMSFVLNGGLDRLVPIQDKFTADELRMFNEVLDRHNFKKDKIVDSLITEKEAYHRHDYTVGSDNGLVYIIKMSSTPITERFEKGHYKNDYSIAMASKGGSGMPFPYYTRHKTMESLCEQLDSILD